MDARPEWVFRLDSRCQLGEGLIWCTASAMVEPSLLFVDIHGRRIHAVGTEGNGHRSWQVPERLGWLIPHSLGDGFVAGLRSGFARLWLEPAVRIEWLHRVFESQPQLRLNDAKADAAGNIWAGNLNDDDNESRPDGVLFRLATTGTATVVDTGYCVANGPAISPDGGLLLHTDSMRRVIFAFELDAPAGTISGKRVWKKLAEDEGYPDGMNFDAEGCLWLAHWGAGCVSRFDTTGSLLRRVQLPVSNVTNVCFGGARLDRLFVTTARAGPLRRGVGRAAARGWII